MKESTRGQFGGNYAVNYKIKTQSSFKNLVSILSSSLQVSDLFGLSELVYLLKV